MIGIHKLYNYISDIQKEKVKLIAEKVELRLKRPALHVLVKVAEIRILVIRFVKRHDAIGSGKKIHKGRLTRAHISGNRD